MKKIVQKMTALLLVCVLLLSASSCSFQSEEEKFEAYLKKTFVETLGDNIMSIHFSLKDPDAYGIKRPKEISLGELDLDNLEKGHQENQKELKKLQSFDRAKLNAKQQDAYDVLLAAYETEVMAKGMEYYQEVFSPIGGVQTNLQTNFVEYPFYTKRDVEDYIALLNDTPRYMKQLLEFEKEKSQKGLFMMDDIADKSIEQCKEFIANPEENCLIQVFDEKIKELSGLTAEDVETLKAANKKAISESVIPAYQIIIDELTKLKGTGKNDKGLANLPNGKAYYEYLVASKVGSEKTVPQLIQAVEKELTTQLMALGMIMQTDPTAINELSTIEISVSKPEEIMETLKTKIKDTYPAFPDVNYTIKPIYKAVENENVLGYCLIPPIDDQSNNAIRINESAQSGRLSLFTLLAHEGYPGHMYQNTYWMAQNPYPIRTAIGFLGYSEGWATYVEREAYEMSDLKSDAVAQLHQINDALNSLLVCRVDLGVNYEGWDLAKTKEFMSGYGITDEAIAKDIYISVIGDPAVYLPYYVGYMEVKELEEYAEKQLGDKFDVKEFRRAYLDIGEAPFKIVKRAVDQYIEKAKAS